MSDLSTRVCTGKHGCGRELPIESFRERKHRKPPNNREVNCKQCEQRRRRAAPQYKVKRKARPSVKNRRRGYQSWRYFYSRACQRCRRADGLAGREFSVTIEQAMALHAAQGSKCAVTGLLMTHNCRDLCSASIDRIDSSIGHIIGNVQLVCRWVNLAKGEHHDNEFRAVLAAYVQQVVIGQ